MSVKKFASSSLATALALAAASLAAPAFAADTTVVVTPTAQQGWTRTDYRGTSNGYTSNTVAQIDGTYVPAAGENGSYHFSTTDGSGKSDYTLYTFSTGLKLGDITALSYDYLRSSTSTVNQWLTPAIRIYYDADGNFGTSADQGYLIFEPVYNELAGSDANHLPSPTNAWVHEDVIGAKFWQRQMSPGMDTTSNGSFLTQTIAGWETAGSVGNGDLLSANSAIIGINFGVGSGWNGTFDGAVDHVALGINGNTTTYNFETSAVAAVPEPSTYAMLALGLGALGWTARRRRRG